MRVPSVAGISQANDVYSSPTSIALEYSDFVLPTCPLLQSVGIPKPSLRADADVTNMRHQPRALDTLSSAYPGTFLVIHIIVGSAASCAGLDRHTGTDICHWRNGLYISHIDSRK